jgi:glycosyltransferase involved in cell wall biosynthesis
VIPPGIDLDQFTAGDRDHERPRILFVGGNFERKGGELLLRVHQQRFAERADLVIVTRDEVPEAPGVRVHRNVGTNSPELRELYATSDLFVLPTRADCYSLVGMEALAAGMPVITTRVGGVGEVVRDGETGFAVEVDDEAGLGDAIEVLVKDASRRQQMGLAGRADAAKRFDARINARRLFEFVQSRS